MQETVQQKFGNEQAHNICKTTCQPVLSGKAIPGQIYFIKIYYVNIIFFISTLPEYKIHNLTTIVKTLL